MRSSILMILTLLTTLFAAKSDSSKVDVRYGSKGFEFETSNGNNLLQIEFRAQFRAAFPTDDDPLTIDDFNNYSKDKVDLFINRARMKVGGHGFRPWLKFYLEYELASSYLLDYRVMVERFAIAKLKVGQWKAQYNRERIISSGKQQTAERSILTRNFTIDRQQGVSLFGHFKGNGTANFNYWISVLSGMGRNGDTSDDSNLMYMARFQWNFLGRPLPFISSDIAYHKEMAAIVAVGVVTNQSPYTRFSSNGGGQLEGFEDGASGQYRVNQALLETAGMIRGLSWQQELHFKEIDDKVNNETQTLAGNLIQLGIFPASLFTKEATAGEIYGRHAFVIPNLETNSELNQEVTFGGNWFFNGHRNKVTLEGTYFNYSSDTQKTETGMRYRVQWDISI
jgi:phosphate-selective porin OprO/OprP